PLHRVARPGAGVQDRPAEDQAAARRRGGPPRAEVRHTRLPRRGPEERRAATRRARGAHAGLDRDYSSGGPPAVASWSALTFPGSNFCAAVSILSIVSS